MQYVAVYLLFINVISAMLCVIDKIKAKLDTWRISEKTLLVASLVGGALGMYVTMQLIRHKTQHKRFMVGLPLIIFVQAAILVCLLYLFARL